MSGADGRRAGGIGLLGAVFLVFLVLKLIGKIAWSWWWVTAPLWMPVAVAFAIIGAIFIFAMPASLIGDVIAARRRNKRLAELFRRDVEGRK